MDYEPEELKRQTSISTGFAQIQWKKQTISVMDTPGDQNFFTDTKLCMQAADATVVVVDGVDGVDGAPSCGVGAFNLPMIPISTLV